MNLLEKKIFTFLAGCTSLSRIFNLIFFFMRFSPRRECFIPILQELNYQLCGLPAMDDRSRKICKNHLSKIASLLPYESKEFLISYIEKSELHIHSILGIMIHYWIRIKDCNSVYPILKLIIRKGEIHDNIGARNLLMEAISKMQGYLPPEIFYR